MKAKHNSRGIDIRILVHFITCAIRIRANFHATTFPEKIRGMYWEHPTVTGDVARIFQPCNEEYQQSEKQTHDRKALAGPD